MEPGRRLIHCHPCRKSGTLAQQRKAEEGNHSYQSHSPGMVNVIKLMFFLKLNHVSHFFQIHIMHASVPFKINVSTYIFRLDNAFETAESDLPMVAH